MPSVNKILRQALANPVKMVLMGYTDGSNYNTLPFDQSWYKEQFRPWENSSNYAQKYQLADTTNLQYHFNASTFQLQLVDCSQRVWKTFPFDYNSFAGNTYLYNGTEYSLNTATFSVSFDNNDTGIPEGIYYLLLSVQYDTAAGGGNEETDYHISEPIYLAQKHEGTILLECKHTRIQYNTYFQDYTFSMRVEGDKFLQDLKASDTQYNNQNYNIDMLNSYPYRIWQVEFGGAIGIPLWLWDRLHILMGLKNILIESEAYTKDEGAEWSSIKGDGRIWPSLNIREKDNYSGLTIVNRSYLEIFEVPTFPVDPYMVHSFVINSDTYYVKKAIYNSTDINNLVIYLNGAFKAFYGFLGSFSLTDGKIVYRNAPSENYDTASAALLTKSVVFTKPVSGTSGSVRTITIDLDFILYGIDYGDGTVIADGDGTPNTALTVYTYPSGTNTYSCRLFHQNSITSIGLSDITVNSITGLFPSDLTDLNIQGAQITSFAGSMLAPALSVFETLTIGSTQLASVTGLNQIWVALQTFDFRGNKLTSSSVDSICQQVDQAATSSAPLQSGAHNLRLENQTPAAPPTIISSIARTHLIFTYSWTITTD